MADVERRRADRENTLTSLSRLLDAARSMDGMLALVVSDETGCLVAGAGAYAECEELAATAPLAANDVVPTRLDVVARGSAVRRLCIDGVQVLIAARLADGAPHQAIDAALDHATAGCRRILSKQRRL